MSGISFVIDEHGKKTAAVIGLRRHGQWWEDIYDSLAATKFAERGTGAIVVSPRSPAQCLPPNHGASSFHSR